MKRYDISYMLQDNFKTAKMIKIGPQTIVVLPLEHGTPDIFLW